MVPVCLVDEENDSVLEVNDDKVIVNPNMDLTNLNQHWYIYPHSQRDGSFTIMSRREQKALQLDDNGELIVKDCDYEEEAIPWTIDHGWIILENRLKNGKRFKVYPVVGSYCVVMIVKQRGVYWNTKDAHILTTNLN